MIEAASGGPPPVSDRSTAAFRARGHDRAAGLVRTMIAGRTPHALLISGPPAVGKTTLALDLAAGLLCDDPDPAARPCRACRACRLVDRGVHPDLHRLAPSGPADQIRIGDRDRPDAGTVRRLISDLVLLPVEGGARVAILERADRLTDDAQTALLKTLEEPPSRVTIVLCADDEERLMPTVRSRCTRIRLGPVAVREVEAILTEMGVAEPPLAARLARLVSGRPGAARILALAPDAMVARDEIARTLLDLMAEGPAARLSAARDLSARAADLARAIDRASAGIGAGGTAGRPRIGRGKTAAPAPAALVPGSSAGGTAASPRSAEPGPAEDAAPEDGETPGASASAAERRRAATILIGLWRDLVRDLLLVRLGDEREVRDAGLLEDLRAAAARLGPPPDGRPEPAGKQSLDAALATFLARLDTVGELVEANTRPELALDSLLLAWPRSVAP